MGFAPLKLNTGGTRIKTNFSRAKVASSVNSNKSSAAKMVKNGRNTFGTNALFTAANRTGGTVPRYANASQLSRSWNTSRGSFYANSGIQSFMGTSGISYNQQVSASQGMSSYDKGMAIASVGLQAIKLLGDLGVFGSKDSTPATNGGKIGSAINSLGGNGSSDVQNAISNMETASTVDSSTLRTAIEGAEGTLSTMNSQTAELQKTADEAKTDLGTAEQASKDADVEVKTADRGVSTAKNNVNTAKGKRDKAITNFTNATNTKDVNEKNYRNCVANTTAAESDYKNAQTRHTDATTAKNSAKATLDSTPKTKDDGNGNQVPNEPAYTNAQNAFKEAEAAEKRAEKAENDAKNKLNSAQSEEKKAKDAFSKAKTDANYAAQVKSDAEAALKQSNDDVKTAEDGLATAEKTLDEKKDAADVAKEKFEKLNNAAGALSSHLKNVQTLTSAIDKYKEKLTKLEDKEAKQYESNTNENNKLNGKYDFTDNKTSKGERRAASKIAENNTQNRKLSGLLDETFVSRNAPANGAWTDTNTQTGTTVYALDGKQVTQSEYDQYMQSHPASS